MLRPSRRTTRPSLRPRALAVGALAVAGAVTLAACGNNGVAKESNEHTTETAANGQVGSVLVRNAQITLGPATGGGSLALTLYDQGATPDTLTGVTSTQAAAFTLPVLAATGGASPAAATTSTAIAVPVMTAVPLDNGTDQITITGLTGMPQVGDDVTVTFSFLGAGPLTLAVPVVSDQPGGASPMPTVTDANVADGPSPSPSAG